MPIEKPRGGAIGGLFGGRVMDVALAMRDKVARYSHGIPTIGTLIIVKRLEKGIEEYLFIDPQPQIINPSTFYKAQGQTKIRKEIPDYTVKQISHKYGQEQIIGTGIYYIINGELTEDGRVLGGIKCDVAENGLTERALGWELDLVQRR